MSVSFFFYKRRILNKNAIAQTFLHLCFYFVTEIKATTLRPRALKNVKEFEKKSNRGDIRWVREGNINSTQWEDKKVVSFLSSMYRANRFGFAHSKVISKVNGQHRKLKVRQPKLVKDYNAYYGRRRQK